METASGADVSHVDEEKTYRLISQRQARGERLEIGEIEFLEKMKREGRLEALKQAEEQYRENDPDLQTLEKIKGKLESGSELNKEELELLYGIKADKEKITYRLNGYINLAEITELREGRDVRKDLAIILEVNENEITVDFEEFVAQVRGRLQGSNELSKYLCWPTVALKHEDKMTEAVVFPEEVLYGSADLSGLEYIRSKPNWRKEKTDYILKFSKKVVGNVKLNKLVNSENLVLPSDSIAFDLRLDSLEKVPKELTLPRYIGRDLTLTSLKTLKSVEFPNGMSIGRNLDLKNVKNAEDFRKLKGVTVGGYVQVKDEKMAEKVKEILGDRIKLTY